MAPLAALWTRIIYVFDIITGSAIGKAPFSKDISEFQIPIQSPSLQAVSKFPTFDPPDDDVNLFQCQYPEYPAADGWVACNSNLDRTCWLKNTKTKEVFDINTDYESKTPKGITRRYYLELSNHTLDADGSKNYVYVQLFNNTLPGPRLQACWGDTISVTIKNNLLGSRTEHDPGNGTTVHWHGIRQLNTAFADGVNAVTQCPIAPGKNFTYTFKAMQYGTSWYHSHYSLQYAAGALGALTIYGPTSMNYDHQVTPIIMSDWFHEPVYEQWDAIAANKGKGNKTRILVDNTLQSGIGHWPPFVNDTAPPEGTTFNTINFQRGVKYLLRLINGAADTTFVFSIDNHNFSVISTDFVSIVPYETDHVVVGIGQRYNIIVNAVPHPLSEANNFWMRASFPNNSCVAFNTSDGKPFPNNRNGIVSYDPNDRKFPTSSRQNFTIDCADETYYRNITPKVKWEVSEKRRNLTTLALNLTKTVIGYPYYPCDTALSHFELIKNAPMWLNFSYPALLYPQQNFTAKPWLDVVDTMDVPDNEWIQITILSNPNKTGKPRPIRNDPKRAFTPPQHPIHLHGHDFAILDQCVPETEKSECDPDKAELTLHNPPRRDVAFLPPGGYLIIAFRADNPGAWIMHCHIAMHASMGLAIQILENVNKWDKTFQLGWDEPLRGMCEDFKKWTPQNISDPCMAFKKDAWPLQTDSGI